MPKNDAFEFADYNINEQTVSFAYKEYRQNGAHKEMTLAGEEFLRRFCLHILPQHFVRIRHYGFLASCNKAKLQDVKLQTIENAASGIEDDIDEKDLKLNAFLCPHCKDAYMICIKIIAPTARAPPFTQSRCN